MTFLSHWLWLGALLVGGGIGWLGAWIKESKSISPPLRDPSQFTGALLGQRYRVTSLLAIGGRCIVYRGIDQVASGPVLVKIPRTQADLEFLARETLLLQLCAYPGIPSVRAYRASIDGYQILDFLEGESLAQVVHRSEQKSLRLPDVLEIIMQLCMIFEYLHAKSPPLIYAALKPSHVLWSASGGVSLIDYSQALLQTSVSNGFPFPWRPSGYAAPELYHGEASPESDIYSLGVLLVFLLTGVAPLCGEEKWISPYQSPPRIENAALRRLTLQLLQVDPALRPKSIVEVRRALRNLDVSDWGA